MNEITRIHIAKQPFNIEIEAKNELKAYLAAITAYAGDEELAREVEGRMVELLAERHIKPEGTIVASDVAALQTQLGEAEAFGGDEKKASVEPTEATKKLYRDTTAGIVGGVVAGIARYFGVQAWWLRVLLIVLALCSFGTVLLVYIVLWIVIPPTKTPADILSLEGKPATISAIHAWGERYGKIDTGRDRHVMRVISAAAGCISALAAVGVVLSLVGVSLSAAYHRPDVALTHAEFAVLIDVLGGGLLLAVLLGLTAYGLLSWRWTRGLLISGLVVILLGLGTFVGAVAGAYWMHLEREQLPGERHPAISLEATKVVKQGEETR